MFSLVFEKKAFKLVNNLKIQGMSYTYDLFCHLFFIY